MDVDMAVADGAQASMMQGSAAGPSSSRGVEALPNGATATTSSSTEKRLPPNRHIPTSAALRRRLTHIPSKQPVLLRLPSGKHKSVELHPGKVVSLGKFGSFKADDIIGLPYGLTYEIVPAPQEGAAAAANGAGESSSPSQQQQQHSKKAKGGRQGGGGGNKRTEQLPGHLQVVVNRSLSELQEGERDGATNEMINDDTESQTLTFLDIQALKEAGLQGREIIQKEVESNTSFQQRTSWSQQKFVLRKESKHLQLFTPVPPSITNVFDFFQEKFDRDIDKMRGLRADSMANILSLVGVAPGGRYIVIDGVGGAVAGAMLERMGGEGRLLALNDADSPPAFDLLSQFGLSHNTVVQPVLRTMHWACTQKDWQPLVQIDESEEMTTPTGKQANDRDKQRFRKRRAQYLELERMRNEFFEGGFDGLVIACPYDCVSIIDKLLPALAGSSHVVVHHPFLQPLAEAHTQIRNYHNLIDVSIMEPFQRKYQVLPGRMHPEMSTSATGGYILHATRVLTDEETMATIRKAKQINPSTENGTEEEKEEPQAKRLRVDAKEGAEPSESGGAEATTATA